MTRMTTKRSRGAAGFSLVEILIVTLVLSLFLLSMAFILKGGLKLYAKNTEMSTLKQQAFTALERIAADWRQNYDAGAVSSGTDLILHRYQTNPTDPQKPYTHAITYSYDAANHKLTRQDLETDATGTVLHSVNEDLATYITALTWSTTAADRNLTVSITASRQGETVTLKSTFAKRLVNTAQTQPPTVVFEVAYPGTTQPGRPRPSGPSPVVW